MKHLKMFGLAAVAAAALTALVGTGTASATTVLCKTNLTTGCAATNWHYGVGTNMVFSLVNKTSARLTDTSGFITIATCTGSTVEGGLTRTTTPKGSPTVTWSGCSVPTDTVTGGELEIHHRNGLNPTVTIRGFSVKLTFSANQTCSYTAGNPGIHAEWTTDPNGADAVLHVNAGVTLDEAHSHGSCAGSGQWIATYTQTSPTPIYVAES